MIISKLINQRFIQPSCW